MLHVILSIFNVHLTSKCYSVNILRYVSYFFIFVRIRTSELVLCLGSKDN